MTGRMRFILIALLGCGLLAGCASNDPEPNLMNIRSDGQGPDEFALLPSKPLQMPEDFAALPTPTPGGANRTDATPEVDAIIALGGSANRISPSGSIPAGDSGLVTYTTRYGVNPAIRDELAAEDLAFRQRNKGRPLEQFFNRNVYFEAYADQSLDQDAEIGNLRRSGIRTVSAPPAGTQ